MPQEILCSGCGCVLYTGEILKSPQDMIKKYEGKCPECGKPLDFTLVNVLIKNEPDGKSRNSGRS